MKKIFLILFAVFALAFLPMVTLAATADEEYEECEEECECDVVFDYEEAVELLLGDMLLLRDLDVAIRDMQVHRNFLVDELDRLEDYGETFEIRIMREMLWELDSAIMGATHGQQFLGMATEGALAQMNAALASITQGGSEEEVMALQAAMAGLVMLSTPDLSAQITMMQGQRTELSEEIERLRESDRIDELTRNARRNINEFDRQTDTLRLHREQTEISIELALRNMIAGMAELDRLETLLEGGISLAEQDVERMTVMYEVGLVSANALSAAEHSLEQTRIQLDELRRGRQTLMHNKNYLLGQPLFQNTVISFERYLPEMPEDLEEHIQSILHETHAVRLSQFELDRAIEARWVYTGHDRAIRILDSERQRAFDPNLRPGGRDLWRMELTREEERMMELRNRIALQEAVERAQASHEQTIRTTEAAILRGFTDLEGLIAQYEALHRDAAQAQTELEAAITGYELGQSTAFEIEQAEMNVFRIETEKQSVFNQKWILAFRLENPSLL